MDGPRPRTARLRALLERPAGRSGAAALVGLLSFGVTVALSSARRVPEGWVGVRRTGGDLLQAGQHYFALRTSSVELFPLTIDLQEASIQLTPPGGEQLRGKLDLRGDLAPEVPRALPATATDAAPPPERARAAVIAAVERALAAREARDLVDSSPFALQSPWLAVAGVERGLRLTSSRVDLVSVQSLRAVAARLRDSSGSTAAGAFLSALAARRPRDAALLCVRGDLARLDGDAARAEELYVQALDLDPALPEAMQAVVARAQQNGEDLGGAERLLRKALAAQPDSIPHLNWLSLVLARRGDLQGAESALVRALALAPDEPTSAINLASLMDRQGRRDDAIAQLRRVLEKYPSHPVALYNLGSALAEQGDLDSSIATFEQAVKVARPSVRLYTRLAFAYEQKGDARKAAEYRERAAQLQRERQAGDSGGD